MKLTKLQILFVIYLRHEKFGSNSWRMLAYNFYKRYKHDLTLRQVEDRKKYKENRGYPSIIRDYGGNQLDGINLEEAVLKSLNIENQDLYSLDLNILEGKIKINKEKLNSL